MKAFGARTTGPRLERIRASPQWRDDRFANALPTEPIAMLPTALEFMTGGSKHRIPQPPPPIQRRARHEFAAPPADGWRCTWLGHSTVLVELGGRRLLLDPIWGERVSPFRWAGPRRFHETPLPMSELPPIDAVLISHDHYDHLDYPTIVHFAGSAFSFPFIVPLGVGAHLERWGVAPSRIVELDWWETRELGPLAFTATPARHFSGRSPTMADRDRTLWAGWAIASARHRLYFSGDGGMFPGFSEIGRRLGPFDATMMEVGAYNKRWRDIHNGPEQAVRAHQMVGGGVLIPVHWGTFDLALHGWTEPLERTLVAAAARGVTIATPRPGATVEPSTVERLVRWWPELPWQPAEEAPVVSSGLEGLLELPA